jgi:hypothetical protein
MSGKNRKTIVGENIEKWIYIKYDNGSVICKFSFDLYTG